MKRLSIAVALAIGGAGWASGCGSGDVADTTLPKPGDPGMVATAPTGTTQKPPTDCIPPSCQVFPLAPSSHALRLTNPQWERTIKDLLKLDNASGKSMSFPPDPVASPDRFGQDAGDLVVSTEYWAAYQT